MRFIYLITFILLPFRLLANQDVVYSVNKGNIHLEYLSGWEGLEIGNKIGIFLELSDKLIKNKHLNSEQIFIYFGHDYTKSDTSYYALGYGTFSYWDYEKKSTAKDVKAKGIKIFIRERDFDIKKMLQLVNSALLNISFIKNNQSEYIVKSKYNDVDTINSIQFHKVQDYLSSSDPEIDNLLNEKIYRNLKKVKEQREIDYYFFNNKFHFYNTREPEKDWSQSQGKYVVSRTSGEAILTVNNIFEIFGNANDGHFVFIDDSSFYFIPQLKDKVRGPFKIDSIRSGRPPIVKYYHENRPIEKFTLIIDNYGNYDKALFIPESNLLISNYDKLENDFVKGLFKKKNERNKPNASNNVVVILSVLLGLSLAIIIWLVMNQRMKKVNK